MLTNFNLLEILECNTHTRNRKSLDDGNVKIVVLVVVTFLNVVVITIEFFVNVAHFYNNSTEKEICNKSKCSFHCCFGIQFNPVIFVLTMDSTETEQDNKTKNRNKKISK